MDALDRVQMLKFVGKIMSAPADWVNHVKTEFYVDDAGAVHVSAYLTGPVAELFKELPENVKKAMDQKSKKSQTGDHAGDTIVDVQRLA